MRLVSRPAVFWVISKHVDNGLVNGPPPRDEQVLEALGKPALLKIEPELQTGQQTVYLGRVIENLLQSLGLGQSSAVRTPCAKQELRKEDEKLLPAEVGVVGAELRGNFALHRTRPRRRSLCHQGDGERHDNHDDRRSDEAETLGRYESVLVRRAGTTN